MNIPRTIVVLLVASSMSLPAQDVVVVADEPGGSIEFNNGLVRTRVLKETGAYREEHSAWNGSWRTLLRGGNALRSEPALMSDGKRQPVAFTKASVAEASPERAVLLLSGSGGGHFISKTITLERGNRFVQCVVKDSVPGISELSYLLSSYSYVPDGKTFDEYRPLDFVWTPQLRPDSDDVIADHTFRSPALMVQHDSFFCALIPEVERIQPWRSIQTSADLQVLAPEAPLLSYGAMNWRTRSHVFYTHSDKMTTQLVEGRFSYGYTLYLDAGAEKRSGFRAILRFLWEGRGRKNLLDSPSPQGAPFATYIRNAWEEYVPLVALDTTHEGVPVTLLSQKRLSWSNKLPRSADRDAWFTVWFNSLRTAYGMYLHGRETGDGDLMQRATRVLNLAMLAPQRDGLSPSVFYVDSAGGHWVGDHGWGGIEGGRMYSMFNNCWTHYWMLAWADLLDERREEILNRSRSLGDFLVREQRPSGVVPSWFDPETGEPAEVYREENAETAGAALFLAELHDRTGEKRYLDAARRAMEYVRTEIVPERKWFDFETFFSCSRKPLDFFDPFTQQYPQNTLSMHQAAEASLSLHRITGERRYRTLGLHLIDYLCLYQQVWNPPWLSRNLFGGFGVQNTDGEWSDSRQGYFAVTLSNYFALTGEREYLERAVAALRAMFSLFESPDSPRTAENYAHSAINRLEGVTGLHWGTGSSVVSIHILRNEYGDAFVHVADGWGVGIDGCTVSRVVADGEEIGVDLKDILNSPRTIRMRFAAMELGEYRLSVNGRQIGRYTRNELQEGVEIEL
ncbi:MAG: hypothetical protein WBG80_09995 [Bacteroidota bacterium]